MSTPFNEALHPRRPDGKFDHTAGSVGEAGDVELGVIDNVADDDFSEVAVTTMDEFRAAAERIPRPERIFISDGEWRLSRHDVPDGMEVVFGGSSLGHVDGGRFTVEGSARLTAGGDAVVHAMGRSSVYADDNARVVATDAAVVTARQRAEVECHDRTWVQASGHVKVRARGGRVFASDLVEVVAMEESQVTARGEASVTAMDRSSVYVTDNASVEASGRSQVRSDKNARVNAVERVHVRGAGESRVQLEGRATSVLQERCRAELHEAAETIAEGDAVVLADDYSNVTTRENAYLRATGQVNATLEGGTAVVGPMVGVKRRGGDLIACQSDDEVYEKSLH